MVLPTYRVLFSQLTSLKILSQTGLGVCLQMILIPVNFTSKINHQFFFIIIIIMFMFIMFICCVCVCLCTCTSVCALWHTRRGQRAILEVGSLLPCESRDQTQVVDLIADTFTNESLRWIPSQPFILNFAVWGEAPYSAAGDLPFFSSLSFFSIPYLGVLSS